MECFPHNILRSLLYFVSFTIHHISISSQVLNFSIIWIDPFHFKFMSYLWMEKIKYRRPQAGKRNILHKTYRKVTSADFMYWIIWFTVRITRPNVFLWHTSPVIQYRCTSENKIWLIALKKHKRVFAFCWLLQGTQLTAHGVQGQVN